VEEYDMIFGPDGVVVEVWKEEIQQMINEKLCNVH
jgi:hypothetical protein